MLIIDYSCGVRLSTATALSAAICTAARNGILIKGSNYLELLAEADTLIFDKTGTMTVGRPEVTSIIPMKAGGSRPGGAAIRRRRRGDQHAPHGGGRRGEGAPQRLADSGPSGHPGAYGPRRPDQGERPDHPRGKPPLHAGERHRPGPGDRGRQSPGPRGREHRLRRRGRRAPGRAGHPGCLAGEHEEGHQSAPLHGHRRHRALDRRRRAARRDHRRPDDGGSLSGRRPCPTTRRKRS